MHKIQRMREKRWGNSSGDNPFITTQHTCTYGKRRHHEQLTNTMEKKFDHWITLQALLKLRITFHAPLRATHASDEFEFLIFLNYCKYQFTFLPIQL